MTVHLQISPCPTQRERGSDFVTITHMTSFLQGPPPQNTDYTWLCSAQSRLISVSLFFFLHPLVTIEYLGGLGWSVDVGLIPSLLEFECVCVCVVDQEDGTLAVVIKNC
jgi:hypothetical protein